MELGVRDHPFTILLVDDGLHHRLTSNNTVGPDEMTPDIIKKRTATGPRGEFGEVIRFVYRSLDVEGVHVYLSDGFGVGNPVLRVTDHTPGWADTMIERLDVLVLDLGGDLEFADAYQLDSAGLAGATRREVDVLNQEFPGAAFYIKERKGKLRSCQLVQILSNHDPHKVDPSHPPVVTHQESYDRILDSHLNPFCDDTRFDLRDGPWTYRHPKLTEDVEIICERIGAAYRNHQEGYAATNQGAVEFAADHDEPVLILGESGTGKTVLARRIHRRWAQQASRRHPKHGAAFIGRAQMAEVNCAALVDELARAELFGYKRGAFSGATSLSYGRLLPVCLGLDQAKRVYKKDEDAEYRESLKKAAGKECLEGDGFELLVTDDLPTSTVFLDEYADLPPRFSAGILRLLSEGEVIPLGSPAAIRGLKFRVIAATSDPDIAARVGVQSLSGGRRRGQGPGNALREDLLSRVHGQVIRAEPIGPEPQRVADQVARFTSTHSRAEWTGSAVKALVESVLRLIDSQSIGDEEAEYPLLPPAFGHFRDLRRILRLADAYVAGARRRGIRNTTDGRVTPEVLKRVWLPATVKVWASAPFESQAVSLEAEKVRRAISHLLSHHDLYPEGLWEVDPGRGLLDALRQAAESVPVVAAKLMALIYRSYDLLGKEKDVRSELVGDFNNFKSDLSKFVTPTMKEKGYGTPSKEAQEREGWVRRAYADPTQAT